MSFLASLHARAAASRRRIVFAEGHDDRVREAVVRLRDHGVVEPVLVGEPHEAIDGVEHFDTTDPALRERVAATLLECRRGRNLTQAEALNRAASPLLIANALVRWNVVHGSVAGAHWTTAEVVRAALFLIGPAEGVRTISSAFYMVVPPFRSAESEVLTFTDCAIVREPSAMQLADIAFAAAIDRRRIVGDEPRVAFLSFSTKGSGRSESVERIREAVGLLANMAPGLAVDGELQGDAAIIESVAARKAPLSPVGGSANVLVFPDLDAGNIAYKLVQRLASANAIGPILQGMHAPCNDLSRGTTTEDIFNVAAITALQADVAAASQLDEIRQETRT